MLFPLRDNNPIRSTPVVTYAIIAANVIAFLWVWRMPDYRRELVLHERGFVPARIVQLVDHKPILIQGKIETDRGPVPFSDVLEPEPRQVYLSLLTCMFLHGGWLHLIGNMWFLWIFGDNVEDRIGPVLYALFYLGGGLLASAVQWWIDPANTSPVIGASGAIAAILGAYAITWPWARVETFVVLVIFFTVIELPALVVLGLWFVIQIGTAALSRELGVAWWAHIGGFLGGLLLMPLLSALVGAPSTRRREPAEAEIVD